MNQDQFRALIREVITSVAALVSTFGILGGEQLSNITALVMGAAMVAWAYMDPVSRPWASLTRKALQAISPVLVSFAIVSEPQGAAITGVLLSLVAVWTSLEKK